MHFSLRATSSDICVHISKYDDSCMSYIDLLFLRKLTAGPILKVHTHPLQSCWFGSMTVWGLELILNVYITQLIVEPNGLQILPV